MMSEEEAGQTIEEANAAIGAAVATCSLSPEFESLLNDIQYELIELAENQVGDGPLPGTGRLHTAVERYSVPAYSRGFPVLGGQSDAAGLLKLARAVTRRAARSVEKAGSSEYLTSLAELLLAIAWYAEEAEQRRYQLGSCTEPMNYVV